MSDIFTIEDEDNIRDIVLHHRGIPQSVEEKAKYEALLNDLLRYCTRLRNQPNTRAHTEVIGNERYQVPAHELIRYLGEGT